MKLSGWGRYPIVDCVVSEPRSIAEVERASRSGSLIARGNGRAYGDSAVNAGLSMSMLCVNHMLAFDPCSGLLVCESGVLLSDVLDVFVPRGFFPPVTPGTKFVTIGGMIAADVHGKNHHVAGSFGQHVEWMDVLTPDQGVVRCSRSENDELFGATVGGMGLTGVILRAAFKLLPIETAYVRQETIVAENLDEVMAAFESSATWTYSVAWVDCLSEGAKLGRSLLYRGEHAAMAELKGGAKLTPLALKARKARRVPLNFPPWILNRWSLKAFNELYFNKGKWNAASAVVGYDTYFYPLDAILDWNRIYGARGFAQYQCVIPKEQAHRGLQRLLAEIARAGEGSFLAVLKLFGKQSGVLSFPMEGYTLALDFPLRPSTLDLLNRLDAIVLDHQGRLYLAKDSRVSAETFHEMQPNLKAFQAFRKKTGADARFSSQQSVRLEI